MVEFFTLQMKIRNYDLLWKMFEPVPQLLQVCLPIAKANVQRTKTEEPISKYRVHSIKYPTFGENSQFYTVPIENMAGL